LEQDETQNKSDDDDIDYNLTVVLRLLGAFSIVAVPYDQTSRPGFATGVKA
jgi:hypothetical protein